MYTFEEDAQLLKTFYKCNFRACVDVLGMYFSRSIKVICDVTQKQSFKYFVIATGYSPFAYVNAMIYLSRIRKTR